MSSGMHLFIETLLLSLLLSVLGVSLFRIAILRKISPPFRGKLSRKQSKASMRYMLTFCLLWAGIEVCILMLHDDHEMRLYNGFMALIFLAMAWLAPRQVLIRKFLRTKFFRPDTQSSLHVND